MAKCRLSLPEYRIGTADKANAPSAINRQKTFYWKNTFINLNNLNCHNETSLAYLGPVVQSLISTNPGLTLNKTYRVYPGLALIGL